MMRKTAILGAAAGLALLIGAIRPILATPDLTSAISRAPAPQSSSPASATGPSVPASQAPAITESLPTLAPIEPPGPNTPLPMGSVDASAQPVFRGSLPGQPRLVFHLVLSQWLTNVYILVGKTDKAIVIDPTDLMVPVGTDGWDLTGRDSTTLLETIRKNHLDVRYAIATHGHLDHVSGFRALKQACHCEICMAPGDIDADGRPKDSHMFPGGLPKVDHRLSDGEMIRCDGMVLKVLYTPGHSPGSISLLCGNWVFSGDTLFYHSVGRTNFRDGSGDWDAELKSIRTRLYRLPSATLVMPGHYAFTTIGEEKANNPWTMNLPASIPLEPAPGIGAPTTPGNAGIFGPTKKG